MPIQSLSRFYSIQEYLALEENAEYRSEYRNGEIIPMTGGSLNHNQIVVTLVIALTLTLREQNYL